MSNNAAAIKSNHGFKSLQILRALASSSVVYFHIVYFYPSWMRTFGSFGVDLFFVLSGFVIAMITNPDTKPLRFALDRITRVAPLYWILTTMMLLLAALAPALLTATTASIDDYLKSLFFIPYFKSPGSLQPMLGVGWTLNYEMLFYLASALSLLVFKGRHFILSITLLLFSVWGMARLALSPDSAFGSFLGSTLIFEFIMGMITWKCVTWSHWQKIPQIFYVLAIILLYWVMAIFEHEWDFRPLKEGLPACLIVLSAYQLEESISILPKKMVRLLTHLGDASYATYLSHLFVVNFCKRLLSKVVDESYIYSAPGVLLILGASLLVGSLIYWYVDKPGVKIARKWSTSLAARAGFRT